LPAQATWWLQMPEGEIPGGGTADAFLERYLRSETELAPGLLDRERAIVDEKGDSPSVQGRLEAQCTA
jgi:hypothetical protein